MAPLRKAGTAALFACILLTLVPGIAGDLQAQDRRAQLSDLKWLAGCWTLEKNGLTTEEQWMKPAGGMMIGMSRTVVRDTTREYEFVVIRQEPDGSIAYHANPSGQPPAVFTLVRWNDREVIFGNPDHDFPQRIIYRLEEDDLLLARIEGEEGGVIRGADFPMHRTGCEYGLNRGQ